MANHPSQQPIDGPVPEFQPAGVVPDFAYYVGRKPDLILPELLKRGEYCEILGPRQLGKTSLRLRLVQQLGRHGVSCAVVDLGAIAGTDDAETWYWSLVAEISRHLGITDAARQWNSPERRALPPAMRWQAFVREVVLDRQNGAVVLIFDELQAVRACQFPSDEFLASIRAFHEARGDEPAFRRLSVCLLSVVAPTDLLRSHNAPPLNFLRRIELDDFTRVETGLLRPGLAKLGADADRILGAIHEWTDGHPYMTVRLCAALARLKKVETGDERRAVDRAVEETFLRRPFEDSNLAYADRRFEDSESGIAKVGLGEKIDLYGRVLRKETVAAVDDDNVQLELRLTGLLKVVDDGGERSLRVRNKIYGQVFDEDWLRGKSSMRFFSDALWQWIDSGKKPEALLRGEVLQRALSWSKTAPITDKEREFLDASLREERSQIDRENARRKRHARHIVILSAALVLAIAGSAVAYMSTEVKHARQEAEAAKQAQDEANTMRAEIEARAEGARKATEEAQKKLADASSRAQAAAGDAQAALRQARVAGDEVAAARRNLRAVHEEREKAERTAQETQHAATKARHEVAAAERQREEVLQQARDVKNVAGADRQQQLQAALAKIQGRAATMASQIGRLEQELSVFANEQAELQVCQAVVEAQRGGGVQVARLARELEKELGRAVSPQQVSNALLNENADGSLCPGGRGWKRAKERLAARLAR